MEPRSHGKVSTASSVGFDLTSSQNLSITRTIFSNPLVILCTLYGNIGALMYGFDNITLSLCLDMEAFVQHFGVLQDGQYVVPTYWQSLWNALPQLTTGLGAWLSGPVSDRYGRRMTMLLAGILSIVGVAVIYTSHSSGQFLAGKLINSLGLGAALAAGQTYISEITPTNIRGIALAVYTVCLSVGYLVAASIAFTRVTIMNESAYRVLFAAEWSWPALLCIGAFLVPESPYYLVRKGKLAQAAKAASKLHRHWSWLQVETHIQTIVDTSQHEAESAPSESSTFLECFKVTNWRRTRIVLYANGLSQMVGATFINNAPYFMVLAGLSSTDTAMMIEIGIAMSILSSILTLWTMARVGRRTIVLAGVALAAVLFLIMGISASLPTQSSASLWCVAITLQMVWLSIGPANGPALAMAAEVSSVRLRAKTLALGFFFNYAWSTVWNLVVPYMFNTEYGNLGGRTGWVFFATSLVSLVVVWCEFPETKDLSFEQIDRRFEMNVRTRSFMDSSVDATAATHKDIELGAVEQVEIVDQRAIAKSDSSI